MDQRTADIAKKYAKESHEEELELLRTLAQVPAPSGDEGRRAAFVRNWLLAQGAKPGQVVVDEAKNVVLTLPGEDRGAVEIFSAHTDVVAQDTEPLPFHEDDERMYAPGVGDDTANLVGLLMAAKWFLTHKPRLAHDVLVVANSCEEGLGNLKGTRWLMGHLDGRRVIDFTSFDLYLGQHITHAVGSHRWRVRTRTAGGHSWENAGAPNAIEAMTRIVGGLYAIPLPQGAKTSVNVGTICGGTTVNSIAAEAEALMEYRSASQENLLWMRGRFEELCDSVKAPGVEVEAELIGERPASLARDPRGEAALIEEGDEVIRELGGVESRHQDSSTDANIPLSLGIPAQTIGAVSGGLLHTRDEWIEKASLVQGLELILGLMLDCQAR